MTRSKPRHLLLILLVVACLTLWNPLAFTADQKYLVASLLAVLAIWATDALHKSLACLVLLGAFLIFGKTPAQEIFSFAWSETNLLIITTTLLSVGLMNTGLVHRLIGKVMAPFVKNPILFMLFPYLLGTVLVFLIPQGFARVIVVGTILDNVLNGQNKEAAEGKSIWLFNAFLGVTFAYMLFPNGDIVLNHSALQFAGPEITKQLGFINWFSLMAFPTIITIFIILGLVQFLYKKPLQGALLPELPLLDTELSKDKQGEQKVALLASLGLLIFWQTSQFHGLPAWIPSAAVVGLFFFKGILTRTDWKQVNPHFLLFLLTIFAIGKVLGQSGVTTKIFETLQTLLPKAQSPFYLLIIMALVMVLHLSIGSAVATMSVILPLLIPLMASVGYQGALVLLMTYTLVNIHFLLPFHHATMMIGIGKGYYSEKTILRFGLAMTFLAPLIVLFIYFTWWKILGWN